MNKKQIAKQMKKSILDELMNKTVFTTFEKDSPMYKGFKKLWEGAFDVEVRDEVIDE